VQLASFRYLDMEWSTELWTPRFGKLAIKGTDPYAPVLCSTQKQTVTRMQVTKRAMAPLMTF